jgi:ABC-type uncharacterized transport system substrate-binding protein
MAKKKRKSAKSRKSGRAKKPAKPDKTIGIAKPDKTIGLLHSGRSNRHANEMTALKDALKNAGYDPNKNLAIDEHWSDDDPQKLADNANMLANDDTLDLIIAAGGTASVYALYHAQNRSKIINKNVVFTSFSQQKPPAPNMTGVNAQTSGLDVARMQYLYGQYPTQTTFGVLENQTRPDFDLSILQDWADQTDVKLDRHSVSKYGGENDQAVSQRIDEAFDDWKQKNIKYAQVCADPIFNDHRPEVTKAANRNGITIIYQWKEFWDDGGKTTDIVFGTDLIEAYKQAGRMAGHVLDLADPNDIAAIPVHPLTPQVWAHTPPHKRRGRKSRR